MGWPGGSLQSGYAARIGMHLQAVLHVLDPGHMTYDLEGLFHLFGQNGS